MNGYGKTVKQSWQHLRQLHQVPCSRCVYFTGDYRLKCTINPTQALTEAAIGCKDFEAVCAGCQQHHQSFVSSGK